MSIQTNNSKRLTIHAKDLEIISGKTTRAAQMWLAKVRKKLGKTNEQVLTISEFCEYTGLNEDIVRSLIV